MQPVNQTDIFTQIANAYNQLSPADQSNFMISLVFGIIISGATLFMLLNFFKPSTVRDT